MFYSVGWMRVSAIFDVHVDFFPNGPNEKLRIPSDARPTDLPTNQPTVAASRLTSQITKSNV